jgi:hypothetical protein
MIPPMLGALLLPLACGPGGIALDSTGSGDAAVEVVPVSVHAHEARIVWGPLVTSDTAATVVSGVATGDDAGWDAVIGPDTDGDGVADLLVGAWGVADEAGAAYLWRGRGI